MSGLKRNLTDKIDQLLEVFPVVLLIGARQTGKTTLSKVLRPGWQYFDLENGKDYDLITRDYNFFFSEYPRHIILPGAGSCDSLVSQRWLSGASAGRE